ncbi:YY1-associated factor 2 [Eumeta japonica]|uniref:YY1-associated factor 2 n=1 Tax=Eumeta variegata TaxID=151549 RepID=A0A4C1T9C0_EUMVA|nr:YY1-associated factor 2 [Eumeta japonica]
MDKKNAIRRAKRPSKVLEENYWDCSVCTYRNNAEAFKCSMCDVRKGLYEKMAKFESDSRTEDSLLQHNMFVLNT